MGKLSLASWALVTLAVSASFGAPGGAQPPSSGPAARPGTRSPADPGARATGGSASANLIEQAIAELRAEYQASLRDPNRRLREKATYFIDRPAKLDQKDLLWALENIKLGNDSRLNAYLRWQLLSGAPQGDWQKELVPRLVDVYHRAPLPTPRYGATEADRRKLDTLLANTKPEESLRLTDLLEDAVKKGEENNRVAIAYRDELYGRLPVGYDRFSAGLRDAFDRLSVGWPPKEMMDRIFDEATVWANSGAAEPRQYAAVAQLIFRLRTERSPKYYIGVANRKSTNQPYWVFRTDALYEAKKLAELQKLLEDKAGLRRPSIDAAAGASR